MRRGDPFPSSMPPGTPILVATRNDALAGVVDATPAERRRDLVFMQNGMLLPWQEARGLGDATQVRRAARDALAGDTRARPAGCRREADTAAGASQVLIYFAVAKLGEMPTDGKTELNPEARLRRCGCALRSRPAR